MDNAYHQYRLQQMGHVKSCVETAYLYLNGDLDGDYRVTLEVARNYINRILGDS